MKLHSFHKYLFILTTSIFCNIKAASDNLHDQKQMVQDMFNAIKDGDPATVKTLIRKYPGIVYTAKGEAPYWWPLHEATTSGKKGIIELLVENGARVNVRDHLGMTPLHWAANLGFHHIAQFLRDNGADIESETTDGESAQALALKRGDAKMAKYLISQASLIDAIAAGDFAAVKEHLEAKPKLVNAYSQTRNSYPLQKAIYKRKTNIVRLLLYMGAKTDQYGGFDGNMTQPLHAAAKIGDTKIAQLLITNGANVNAKNIYSTTPLHFASQVGNRAVVELLIENGAWVSPSDTKSLTPLHEASKAGNLEIVLLLVRNGAYVPAKDLEQKTPLHYAATKGHLDVVKLLVAYGAVGNAEDYYKSTSLHWAAQEGHLDIVRFLCDKGADISLPNRGAQVSLHYAAMKGHLDVAKFLLKHGANIETRNKKEKSALAFALENGHTDVAKYLIARHAAVGKNQGGIEKLPDDLLTERRKNLVSILQDAELPRDLCNLVITFVTEV